ncbi:MAG: hypothetical protein MUE69_11470 [Myxococcota bacterium]|jgi:hypothetical protein|nr:hypothetical protein [Myxococcota bacterium]
MVRRSVGISTSSVGLLVALALACSGDDEPTLEVDAGPRSGVVFFSLTEGPEGRTGYLRELSSLDVGEVDNADATEITGNARVYVPGDGRVFVGSGEAPTVTEHVRDERGRLVPRRVVSLASFVSGGAPFGHVFVSADRALLFADDVVIWNPTEMILEGTTSLDDAVREGRAPSAGVGVRRGDRLYVPVSYAPFPNVDDRMYVLVLDAEGAVIDVLEDDRGQQTGALELADDGTIYVASDNGYVLPRFGTELVRPSVVLRILPDADGFDPEWSIDLRAATGGDDATGFEYVGGDRGFVLVHERALVPAGAEEDPRLHYESRSSRWWSLDLTSGEASRLDTIPAVASGSGIASRLRRRDSVWLAVPESFPAAENRFFEASADGTVVERFAFFGRGQLFDLGP